MSAKLWSLEGEVLEPQQQPCTTFYSVYQMMKYFQLTTSKWDNGSGGGAGRLIWPVTSCNWSDSGGGRGRRCTLYRRPGNERC